MLLPPSLLSQNVNQPTCPVIPASTLALEFISSHLFRYHTFQDNWAPWHCPFPGIVMDSYFSLSGFFLPFTLCSSWVISSIFMALIIISMTMGLHTISPGLFHKLQIHSLPTSSYAFYPVFLYVSQSEHAPNLMFFLFFFLAKAYSPYDIPILLGIY